jgi:hypothetical protein
MVRMTPHQEGRMDPTVRVLSRLFTVTAPLSPTPLLAADDGAVHRIAGVDVGLQMERRQLELRRRQPPMSSRRGSSWVAGFQMLAAPAVLALVPVAAYCNL